jgi:hypothetical protein
MAFTHSQHAYAKHLGISQPTVNKYIRLGILDGATKKIGQRVLIDPDIADQLLPQRLDPHKRKTLKIKKAIDNKESESKDNGKGLRPDEERIAELLAKKGLLNYSDARMLRENINAERDNIKLQSEKGDMVLRCDIIKEADIAGRVIKDQLTAFKDRLSAVVAPLTDEFEIKQIIGKEVEYVLNTISTELKKYVS